MARYRTYSIEFKRQVVQEYLEGVESLHGLAKRHQVSRNLIRIWLAKYQDGEFNEDAALADSIQAYEARIAALERKLGQLLMENELLKKTLPPSRSATVASSSIVSGPVSAGRKDVGP